MEKMKKDYPEFKVDFDPPKTEEYTDNDTDSLKEPTPYIPFGVTSTWEQHMQNKQRQEIVERQQEIALMRLKKMRSDHLSGHGVDEAKYYRGVDPILEESANEISQNEHNEFDNEAQEISRDEIQIHSVYPDSPVGTSYGMYSKSSDFMRQFIHHEGSGYSQLITSIKEPEVDEEEEVIINITELADHYAMMELGKEFVLCEETTDKYNEILQKHTEIIKSFKRTKNG